LKAGYGSPNVLIHKNTKKVYYSLLSGRVRVRDRLREIEIEQLAPALRNDFMVPFRSISIHVHHSRLLVGAGKLEEEQM
jgi:hypothetical protein